MAGTKDNSRKSFPNGLEEAYPRMSDACFTIMNRELRFNICGLEDSFQLNVDVPILPVRMAQNISESLRYVALFWLSHLRHFNSSKEDCDRVDAFLNSPKALFWIEVLSLLGVIEGDISILQDCANLFSVSSSFAVLWGKLTFLRIGQVFRKRQMNGGVS